MKRRLPEEAKKSARNGLVATLALGALILLGSRNLAHFDAALVAYTFSVLFATFGITYRYSMWLARPPTGMYWRRGWSSFFQHGLRLRNLGVWLRRSVGEVLANGFIFRRDPVRGLTHMLIMWGCIIAVLITFPLVFGWIYFEPVIGELETYRVVLFGFPMGAFPTNSVAAFLLFHGLVWASFFVIAGVMLAMRRRMRDAGAASVQRFVEDFMPLILLFAVSLTGLMLSASNTWLRGYAFSFIMIVHAVTVIGTFLWLPFGKFFHVFQRPAQLGVGFYKDVGARDEAAHCRRCGHDFTSRMHVEDLIQVQRELGFTYEVSEARLGHYQWVCPPCRRAAFAIAQGLAWRTRRGPATPSSDEPEGTRPAPPMPVFANPGVGEGPLGSEDAANFHP